eukprot:gnl/TRDRNA2_/TRDRNA2_175577_c3_seq36.p1 gnl/TRDRNA2_/TRDRNA2_175577_c3~~gnl/TRDRNA2_/TRDRNA2_175577_c3_seq36.p1  ORF type:complete len:683 (+),score=225.30 gnl/TRDRNA2_/TRDRNA2_175577_c3_seq36:92-2140(+)
MTSTTKAMLICAVCLFSAAPTAAVTPIEKVISLMNELVTKAVAEKEDEATKFAAFSSWCDNTKGSKTREIDAGNTKIEELKAKIAKDTANIRSLSDRIMELEEDVGRWKTDQASATEVRNKENLDYKATLLDYDESIDGLEGAIAAEKAQAHTVAQASLIQVANSKTVPAHAKKALLSLIQRQPDVSAMPSDEMAVEAPSAAAYEFQGQGTVEVLEKVEHTFEDEKPVLEEEEMKAQHAYESVMQGLTDSIEGAEHEIDKKSNLKGETEMHKGQAEGDLAQTTSDRDEDQKYLDDTMALCEQKTADFESRQKLRAEEIEAVNKAIEIMSSNAVAGSGEKHLPTMLQIKKRGLKKTALVQLRSSDAQNPLQARVSAFLADRARISGSSLLMQVSHQMEASPFTKVKKMIKDLISKLMEEATSESEHKGWCDTELTTNQQTRDARTEDVNVLNAKIEDLTAEIASLAQDIEDLNVALQELSAEMSDVTADRMAAKAKNEATIADAKAAQTAVEEATAVLKDFYAKSATATALVQQQSSQPAADAPETFDKPYQGALPEGGSVVDFLEVILTDFSRLESDTTTQETTEKETYDKYMFESDKNKAMKENEMKHKSQRKTDAETEKQNSQTDLQTAQEQLDDAMAYYDKLKPTCVDSGISYEERVKRREEEIQSLGEALKILSGDDI